MQIDIASEIRRACPALRLGHLSAQVEIAPSTASFWEMAEPLLQERVHVTAEEIRTQPVIAASRWAYKALGQDPSRYRLSAEALQRRLMKDQGLYRLNNVVDLINLVSLQSGFSIGGYDREAIAPSVQLRLGRKDDVYASIGRGALNIAHLPVLVDQQGPFGNPTSDSARTCIRPETQSVWLVLFDFDGQSELEATLKLAGSWLESYAQARGLEYAIQS